MSVEKTTVELAKPKSWAFRLAQPPLPGRCATTSHENACSNYVMPGQVRNRVICAMRHAR